MLIKIKLVFQLLANMGPRYLVFRVLFELKKKSGILKKAYPVNPPKINHIDLDSWKLANDFYVKSREDYKANVYQFEVDVNRNSAQKNGDILFFSSIEYQLGKEYNWLTNPDTGFNYDINKHWLDVNDFSADAGDIKYVWEKSRFSYIYLTIRNDIKYNTDSSEFIFDEIKSWIKHNPINQGPNYKCSQEISLRTLNWNYALQFYRNSSHLTPDLFNEIMHVIYWQIKHVYSNINFSRIAVRNNHAITESLMIYLGGLIYPYFPESKTWKIEGKKWFEEEILYQIYPDGTFLQFSMNYHRVVVQLFNLAFSVSQYYKVRFNNEVYLRAYKSLNFLYQSQELTTGELPNYGANDGALFFPLSNCSYRDYRPSLNTLHNLLTNYNLYPDGPWDEELVLLGIHKSVSDFEPIKKKLGWSRFDDSGYYILNELNTMTFIRCGNHKDRPSQADNLHVDIWVNSRNMLIDAGTYKYNSTKEDIDYFFGTESHNSVKINNHNQMLKGNRFIWFYWTQTNRVKLSENENTYTFDGEISAFRYLNKNISHRREIIKYKNKNHWNVKDTVSNKNNEDLLRQLWHPNPQFVSSIKIQNTEDTIVFNKGYYSSMYGLKKEAEYIAFESKNNTIATSLLINENITTAPILS